MECIDTNVLKLTHFQAIIPFVTTAFPILLDLTTVLIGTPIPWAGKLAFLLGALAPVINPCVKLSVISCYRLRILEVTQVRKYLTHLSSAISPTHAVISVTQASSSAAIVHLPNGKPEEEHHH